MFRYSGAEGERKRERTRERERREERREEKVRPKMPLSGLIIRHARDRIFYAAPKFKRVADRLVSARRTPIFLRVIAPAVSQHRTV